MSQRDLILSIAILLLIVALPVLLILLRSRQDIRPRAEFADASLLLSPTSINLTKEETTQIDISLNSPATEISAIDISISIDPTVAEITQISEDPNSKFTDVLIKDIQADSARLVLAAKTLITSLPSGEFKIATVTLKGIDTGETNLTVKPNEIIGENGIETDVRLNVNTANTDVSVTEDTAPTPTPTPTPAPGEPTPTPIPDTPQITFDFGFIGLLETQPDLKVLLTVSNELDNPKTQKEYSVQTSSNGNFIYSPSNPPLSLNEIAPGDGKTILLKGPKHLRKKMIDRTTLKEGLNNKFNWTTKSLNLDPGDLPNPNDNLKQDGVVNAIDVALLKSRLFSRDPDDLAVADLNYDGIVNNFDLGLLITTLSTRYDDESI